MPAWRTFAREQRTLPSGLRSRRTQARDCRAMAEVQTDIAGGGAALTLDPPHRRHPLTLPLVDEIRAAPDVTHAAPGGRAGGPAAPGFSGRGHPGPAGPQPRPTAIGSTLSPQPPMSSTTAPSGS